MSWSIIKGNKGFEPHEYSGKYLHCEGELIESSDIKHLYNNEFNEYENKKEYFYIYYYHNNIYEIPHRELNLLEPLKFYDYEIYDYDGYIYIRKKYKEIEILKNVLYDMCYLFNYFKNDIMTNDININKNKINNLDIYPEQKFFGFNCAENKHNNELYFKIL